MQNARAQKLQWSGPTVHSYTVVLTVMYICKGKHNWQLS